MTEDRLIRSEIILTRDGIDKLCRSSVIVFGLGGVGGFTVEALVRSGVGHIGLVDGDEYNVTNLNRQLGATMSTIGRNKAEVMRERVLDINPDCVVDVFPVFFDEGSDIDLSCYDYIADCIDSTAAKAELVVRAKREGVPIISAMGAGNKTDPTAFRVANITDTHTCGLAKVMRRLLSERGVTTLKTVFSTEKPTPVPSEYRNGDRVIGSIVSVVGVEGLIVANEIIMDIAGVVR